MVFMSDPGQFAWNTLASYMHSVCASIVQQAASIHTSLPNGHGMLKTSVQKRPSSNQDT